MQVISSAVVSETAKKKVTECLVGDATATILFKARGKEAEQLTPGRSVRIQGCKVDMYHGSMRLTCMQDAPIEDIAEVKVQVRHLLLRIVLTDVLCVGPHDVCMQYESARR